MITLALSVKDERNGVARDVRDPTGIPHKSLDLFLKSSIIFSPQTISLHSKKQRPDRMLSIWAYYRVRPKDQEVQSATAPPKGTIG